MIGRWAKRAAGEIFSLKCMRRDARMGAGMEKNADSPKVSICIPCYNNVEEVRRLLLSVAGQTFRDVEVIVSDDSTDGKTGALAARILREGILSEEGEALFPVRRPEAGTQGRDGENPAGSRPAAGRGTISLPGRFRYYHNEKPLGHIFNWNRALELAEGEYIKIMFSDDWFTGRESLGEMVSLLEENPDASLAFCGTWQVSEEKAWRRRAGQPYLDRLRTDYRSLFLGNEIGAPSATLYRSCGARFDERSNWASDMFLYFEILSRNPHFVCTGKPLVSIGIHEEQYTGTFAERDIRKFQDSRFLYEKYHLEENEDCRREMLRLTVVYDQGWESARSCGASPGEYIRERFRWFWRNTVLGYWGGLLHKLGVERSSAS